jgi:hypothetical protein
MLQFLCPGHGSALGQKVPLCADIADQKLAVSCPKQGFTVLTSGAAAD